MRKSIGFLPTLALGLASAILSIGLGRATVITYELSTVATGSLDGVAFTDREVELFMQSNTAKVVKHPPARGQSTFTNTGTITVLVSGFNQETFTVLGTIGVTQVPFNGFLPAITLGEGKLQILGATNQAFSTYDLKRPIGPIMGGAEVSPFASFPASSGPLVLSGAFDATFRARVGEGAEVVPEPSSWMLLAIGFAGLGLLHRRGLLRGSAAR